jgi:pimeloyl-ACP methyl ester carboxylesterase
MRSPAAGPSARSPRRHEETTRTLADWLPNAELIALPGVGHFLPLEDPALVARTVADAM